MGTRGRQAEYIGCQLQRGIGLAPTTRHAQFSDRHSRTFCGPFSTLAQCISQSFQNGAVDVGTRGNIAKANDGPTSSRPGKASPGDQ